MREAAGTIHAAIEVDEGNAQRSLVVVGSQHVVGDSVFNKFEICTIRLCGVISVATLLTIWSVAKHE